VHHFDVENLRAEWAYTMDGSSGRIEYENFNAAGAKILSKEKVCILVMPKER
jgi:di/tripeptidase